MYYSKPYLVHAIPWLPLILIDLLEDSVVFLLVVLAAHDFFGGEKKGKKGEKKGKRPPYPDSNSCPAKININSANRHTISTTAAQR